MTQALFTGASGLLAHQRKLDTVANNLANINTTSYKTQRTLFSDLLYSPLQNATGSSDPNYGGTNPQQIGFGVGIAEISRNFSQGVLTSTGETFDFAIQGDGFFVVSGEQPTYTRDGSFSVDRNGQLVDPATGSFVQRIGTVGEGTADRPGFQTAGNSSIYVPLGASVPGQATTESSFIGNLPATAIPPLAEVLTTVAPMTVGGVPVDASTALNDLDSNLEDYVTGDTIDIVGTNVDGSSFTLNLPVGAGATVGDLVTAINGQLVGAQMSISTEGNLVVTADETGEAFLSIHIDDDSANVGSTDFLRHLFLVQTDGKEGDIVESTIQVFDSRGEPHSIQVDFEKQDANHWDATFSSGEDGIELTDNLVASIVFNEDGSFQIVNGVGEGDSDIELTIETLSQPQTISISMDRLTHLATSFNATYEQDGYPPGNIVSIHVSPDGTLDGVATNGTRVPIAQLAMATFANTSGLEAFGQNYFVESANSGSAQLAPAQSGRNGEIRNGQLESSNVDVALEFTQLIVAQRGFSANARTITVATEVLEELNNIIR